LSGYSKDHDQNSTNLCRSYVGGKKKNKQTLELPLQPGGGSGPVTIHDLLEKNYETNYEKKKATFTVPFTPSLTEKSMV
jgi:hypothetical protein